MTKHDPVVVGINLEGNIAHALDQICGITLSSRAGFIRLVLVQALRAEGLLPDPKTQSIARGASR
ncbi:hypothetical protein BK022_13530 [Methylorubrum extorquens]|uniref:Uncharacterized protein n=1 Tax=Methylorubrum extorquens TaxID=408 RepID=A0A1S1P6K2_METEX|nr:hypothetical protein BK022_13530 [Methylorubrum extorquens]